MLVFEPIILFTAIYISLAWSMVFFYFQAYPIIFEGIYDFDIAMTSLTYIPGEFSLFNFRDLPEEANHYQWASVLHHPVSSPSLTTPSTKKRRNSASVGRPAPNTIDCHSHAQPVPF